MRPCAASHSIVCAAAEAPSAHGDDTTISASRSLSASWVTGASIVEPQSMIAIVKWRSSREVASRYSAGSSTRRGPAVGSPAST